MGTSKLNRFWAFSAIFLLAVTAVGGAVAWSRYSPGQLVEISLPSRQELEGSIYIDGAVRIPGVYPFASTDSIGALIQAAGGMASGADSKRLSLYIAKAGEEQEPQKVNINQADVWLLEALPGIGETLAQRIIDYRRQNGPFRNTGELTKVAGIGATLYERIKDLITVAD